MRTKLLILAGAAVGCVGIAPTTLAQVSPFSSNSPYTSVVPGPENPPYPNYTNIDVDNWNTNAGWTTAISIDTQNTNAPVSQQWVETDAYNNTTGLGGTAFLNSVVGYTPTNPPGNTSLLQGGWDLANGILPGATNPTVYRSFVPTSLPAGQRDNVWTFAQFSIAEPTSDRVNQDAFGFEIWNGAPNGGGTSLGKFMFGSQYAFDNSGANSNAIGFAWTLGGVLQTTNNNAALTGEWDIYYNGNYRFNLAVQSNNLITLSLDTLDTASNNFAFITNTTLIRDGALGGVGSTALDYNTVSINWELANNDFNTPGDNFIIVNNLEVITTTVPEPGTWAVGALLLAAVADRIRRRRKAVTKA